jgi:hypothetical protein
MSIRRREFLGSLGTASVAAALPLSSARASAPAPAPVANTWDMAWVDRLKGKYRAVFDSPAFSDGEALFRAVFWIRDYKEVYGTDPKDMSAVLVVRHEGIWLAMNDEFWKKYAIGKRYKFKDDKGWYERNPIGSASPGAPPDFADMTIPKFIAGGGAVLACNLAFKGAVEVVRKENKLKGDEAEKLARTYLIPGVTLQPSGVFAVMHAQEAGCHYILAS